MCSAAVDWLSAISQGFADLTDDEKREIQDFVLIWSYFEAQCLDANASIPTIRQYVQGLGGEVVSSLNFEEAVSYFKNRYIEDGQPTHRYQHLHLDRSGDPTEVEDMLRGLKQSNEDKLIGCLGIVFRYRNNLFHGVKWAYELQEQEENFRHSNGLLQQLMQAAT